VTTNARVAESGAAPALPSTTDVQPRAARSNAPKPRAVNASKSTGSKPAVLLCGNPNVGKTTLFNALTGESARVGNYPGITVERRAAQLKLETLEAELVDAPGTYSLSARSPEEQVAIAAALGLGGNPKPDLVVVVLDAGQLTRNLYLALQLAEFRLPLVLVLTMLDEVGDRQPLPERVGALFGVDCVGINPKRGDGVPNLRAAIERALNQRRLSDVPIAYSSQVHALRDRIASKLPDAWRQNVEHDRALSLWALLSISDDDELEVDQSLRAVCLEQRSEAEALGIDLDLEVVGARYQFIERELQGCYETAAAAPAGPGWTERLDRVLLHPVWGLAFFVLVMLCLFQSLFSWADPAIGWIENAVTWAEQGLTAKFPPSLLRDLVVQGIVGGVGNVIVFLPQIVLLFLLVGLLEDSGYMARIAYLMDRVLRGSGLQGKAFVPMLSGLACAVPAILSTRTMERRRDRILTMLVVPLMTCSARLPVYALLIGALFPPSKVFGLVPIQGLLMVAMYLFSTLIALLAAWVLGRTLVRGHRVPLLLELPRYRWPNLRTTLRMITQRTREFLVEAGTVILALTIGMWILLSFPKPEATSDAGSAPTAQLTSSEHAPPPSIEHTYGGRLGRALEPVVRPLGFDWKLAVGVIGAFSAREVFISTLGLVFGLDDTSDEALPLRDRMRAETRPDGSPAYPPLVGLSLMVFFALACQCMSTLGVVYRETRSVRWPLLLFAYMTTLAYAASFIVYQGGRLLGLG
jgi:ferrous iron transport protein B